MDTLTIWAKGGISALEKMCEEDPSGFCNMIAKLVPKEFQLSEDAGNAFVKCWEAIATGAVGKASEGQDG